MTIKSESIQDLGMWDWDRLDHRLGLVANGPPAAKLAAAIVPGERIDRAYEQGVFQRTNLPGFSMVEASIGYFAREIFKILRDAGSKEGFVVEQVADNKPSEHFRRFFLTDEIADQIKQDCTFEPTMAFIDDKQQCAIATCYSDYSLLCMSQHLFDEFLSSNPLDLTLWRDEPRYPLAETFLQAVALAERRAKSWDERMKPRRA
ncbi:MAG: hypothetical protein AB7F98_01115 [Novosphingobium sp.]